MAKWLNHVAIAAPRNGTLTHTVAPSTGSVVAGTAFTATSGRLLVCVVEGAVTSTTPTGWTLPENGAAINNTGLYVWYRTASGSDSLTTTHNGSNYPVVFDWYEFPTGSTFDRSAQAISVYNGEAKPTLVMNTGTKTVMTAVGYGYSATSGANAVTWASPAVELTDTYALGSGTDGYVYSAASVDDTTVTSFDVGATLTSMLSELERLVWALTVTSASSSYPVIGSAVGVSTAAGGVTVRVPAGSTAVTFSGITNGSPWPSPWRPTVTTGGVVDVQSNTGRLLTGSVGGLVDQSKSEYVGTPNNVEITFTSWVGAGDRTPHLVLRNAGADLDDRVSRVEVKYEADGVTLQEVVAGAIQTPLVSKLAIVDGYTVPFKTRARVNGSNLKFKVWPASELEPGAWAADVTLPNTGLTGSLGFFVVGGAAATAQSMFVDDILIVDLDAVTQFPVVGSAGVVSKAVGAVRAYRAVAGSNNAVSSVSGALARRSNVNGTVPAVSTAAGSTSRVTKLLPISGTVPTSSTAIGVAVLRGRAAGVVAASSVTSGQADRATRKIPATGSVSVASGTAGSLSRVTRPVVGTASVSSGLSGLVWRSQPVFGVVPTVSNATGVADRATRQVSASGTFVATSSVSGQSGVVLRALTGSAPTYSVATGSVAANRLTAGTAPATSNVSGVTGRSQTVVGVAQAASDVTGAASRVARQIPASGTAVAVSDTSGQLSVVLRPVVSTVSAVSATTGTVRANRPITGTNKITSGLTGVMGRTQPVTGVATAFSTQSGAIGRSQTVSGTTPTVTTSAGMVTVPGASDTSGNVSVFATVTGSPLATLKLSGRVDVVAGVSASPRAKTVAAGTVTATTTAAGTVVPKRPAAGNVNAVSSSTGNAASAGTMSGTVHIAATTAGTVTKTTATAGTTNTVTTITGTVAVQPAGMFSGTATVVSNISGHVKAFGVTTGTVPAVTTTAGSVTVRRSVAGSITTETGTAGAVVLTPAAAWYGIVHAVSTITGGPLAALAVNGRVDTITVGVGTPTARILTSGTVAAVTTVLHRPNWTPDGTSVRNPILTLTNTRSVLELL